MAAAATAGLAPAAAVVAQGAGPGSYASDSQLQSVPPLRAF